MKIKKADLIALLMCFLFGLAGVLINLNRFWQYESGYYDFGIFDRAIWEVAHFRLPIIDHLVVGGKIIFADHFSPSLFLFSPLYWFTSKSEILFIAQDIFVALSGFVIYKMAKSVLKSNLLSISVLASYFLFTGLQNAVFSDFHEVTVMTLPLALTYWAILKSKKKLFFALLIITLGYKESLFLLGIGLAIFIYLYKKEWRRTAIWTFIISVIWGIVTIKVIIPHFSGNAYYYQPVQQQNIQGFIMNLFNPTIKIKTVLLTLLSFLFLPIFSPPTWTILLTNWTQRFLIESTTRWDLGLHYNAEIAPTLAVSAILGLSYLKNKISWYLSYLIGVGLLLTSLFLYRFIFHGPFGLAYNMAFYKHTKDFYFLDKMLPLISKDSIVVAQNNLAPRFMHNKGIFFLRENYRKFNADYIVLDLRSGQNINNFLGAQDIQKVFEDIKVNKKYKIYYHTGEQYIFKKI